MKNNIKLNISKQSLSSIFKKTIQEHQKVFPEQMGGLLLVLSGQQVYASPELAEHLKENVGAAKKILRGIAHIGKVNETVANTGEFTFHGQHVNFISVNLDMEMPDVAFGKHARDMGAIFTLDHEIGHRVVKGGFSKNKHHAECVADAYAILRHIQRYGGKTGIFDTMHIGLVDHIIFADKAYYTLPVMHKIEQLYRDGEVDIKSLSLQETSALAHDIAREHKFDTAALGRMRRAFASVRQAVKTEGTKDALVASLAQVMKDHQHDHDVYRAAKLCATQPSLQDFMERKNQKHIFNFTAKQEKAMGFVMNSADAAHQKPKRQSHR